MDTVSDFLAVVEFVREFTSPIPNARPYLRRQSSLRRNRLIATLRLNLSNRASQDRQ